MKIINNGCNSKSLTNKHCQAFRTANDTSKWVLCLDERIGFFNSETEVENALKHITNIHWDDSGHDCMQVLPPGFVPMHVNFEKAGYPLEDKSACYVSDIQSIDMTGYINKHIDRIVVRNRNEMKLKSISSSGLITAAQRLDNKRALVNNSLFLN